MHDVEIHPADQIGVFGSKGMKWAVDHDDAIRFAAWLVTLACELGHYRIPKFGLIGRVPGPSQNLLCKGAPSRVCRVS